MTAGWPKTRQERVGVLTLGVIAGLDGIGYAVALASLMFTGRLAAGLDVAMGSALLCTAIIAVAIGSRSREPNNIGQVQDVAVALLAAMFAHSNISVATAFAIIGVSSLTTGVLFWLTGHFRFGRIVKYFPQAVLVGFLAGTGWLLITGGVATALGFSPSVERLRHLETGAFRRLIPAMVLAALLHLVMRRFAHPHVLFSVLFTTTLAFYGWMAVTGMSIAEAIGAGYLPASGSGSAMQLPFPKLLGDVDWHGVASATPTILTIAGLSLFAMLMNMAALERATGGDLDIDAELRTAGFANAMVGLVGGSPGYTSLSTSVLGHRSGVRHRGAGIVSGVVVGVGFVFAKQIVTHVPTFLSAGFIIFLGVEILSGWLAETIRRYSPTEVLTVMVILGFVVLSGFLEATIAGFVVASLLFAYSYARVPIVRSRSSMANLASTRERSPSEAALLRSSGESAEVVRLHGYLFFGSAEHVVTHVRTRLDDSSKAPLRALVLDATLVPRIDAASAAAFDRIRILGSQKGFRVLLSGANRSVRDVLTRCAVAHVDGTAADESTHDAMITFDSIDPALQDVESWLLQGESTMQSETLRERIAKDSSPSAFESLVQAMRRTVHDSGDVIFRSGELSDELLIIESGSVAVVRTTPTGAAERLREMSDGALLGDIGFILGQERSADIVALRPTTLLRISRCELDALQGNHPGASALMYQIMSRALAEKVITANVMSDLAKF